MAPQEDGQISVSQPQQPVQSGLLPVGVGCTLPIQVGGREVGRPLHPGGTGYVRRYVAGKVLDHGFRQRHGPSRPCSGCGGARFGCCIALAFRITAAALFLLDQQRIQHLGTGELPVDRLLQRIVVQKLEQIVRHLLLLSRRAGLGDLLAAQELFLGRLLRQGGRVLPAESAVDGVGVGIATCFAGFGQGLALAHVVQRVLRGGILVLLERRVEPGDYSSGYRLAHSS
mmetsp:Transcript_25481/g.73699  ORF Transcript_25481/g.73699 Transcript_25481/m.73699 type:complete len:228 (-) Transcript_25481:126-809(-)